MMRGSGQENGSRGGAAGSSLLATAGSFVGGIVASEIASSSVRALHQDSVNRLSYEKECRIAMERGQPVPEPPRSSFAGKQIKDLLKSTMNSVGNMAAGADNNPDAPNQSSGPTNFNRNNKSAGQQEPASANDAIGNIWRMAAAGVKAAKAANQR